MNLNDKCFTYKNPSASKDLIVPIHLVGCLSEADMLINLEENIRHDVPWLDQSPEHDCVAIICGAAPSLNDSLSLINEMQSENGVVFGCNSAAQVLSGNGISVDYQNIIEPHDIVLEKFCAAAKTHLIGSIAPPDLFRKANHPILWHPVLDFVQNRMIDSRRKFSYIGGGVSIGVYSLCLAYTMGFREIHVFGMDSSFKDGEFYANGDGLGIGYLLVDVEHNGKTYKTTYDMKQQVVAFIQFKYLLNEAGCKVFVHGDGLLHDIVNKH